MMSAPRTKHGAALILMAVVLVPVSAIALEQSDTMGRWAESSEHDRLQVLDELRAKNARMRETDRFSTLACMNGAAEIPGHRDLRIGDVASACSEPSRPASRGLQTDI